MDKYNEVKKQLVSWLGAIIIGILGLLILILQKIKEEGKQ